MYDPRLVSQWSLLLVLVCFTDAGPATSVFVNGRETCLVGKNTPDDEDSVALLQTVTDLHLRTGSNVAMYSHAADRVASQAEMPSPPVRTLSSRSASQATIPSRPLGHSHSQRTPRSESSYPDATLPRPHVAEIEHSRLTEQPDARLIESRSSEAAHNRAGYAVLHAVRMKESPGFGMIFGELVLASVVMCVVIMGAVMFFLSDEWLVPTRLKNSMADCKRFCCCCVPIVRLLKGIWMGLGNCCSRVSHRLGAHFEPEGASRMPLGAKGAGGGLLGPAVVGEPEQAPLQQSYRNNLGRPPREDYEARLNSIDGRSRLRAVTLLFLGTISAIVGFLLVACLSMHRYGYEEQTNIRGEPFKSGHNYFPSAINEQIYEPRSTRDKIFFAFGLFSSICLLISWYPWELRNVYVSSNARFFCCNCLWLNMRQYVPPMGLFLMACVSTTPRSQDGTKEQVTVYVYLAGTTMFVCGYIVAEVYTLYFTSIPDIRAPERKLRKLCIVGCMVATILFEFCGLIATVADDLGICCGDDWHVPNRTDVAVANSTYHYSAAMSCIDAMENNRKELFNTASGAVLVVKFIKYWMQLIACLFICASLLAVWWYCPERTMDICESVGDVDEALLDREEAGHSRFAQVLRGANLPRFAFLPVARPGQTFDGNREMSCSQCGTVFVPDSRYCDSCGAERRLVQDAPG